MKFNENPYSVRPVVSCWRTDRRTDKYDETDTRFSQFCERVSTFKKKHRSLNPQQNSELKTKRNTVYHNNITNLIHFHFHNHFIVSWSSAWFGRQASIFRRHYTSSFLVWVVCTIAFGWLQVVWKWKCIKLVTLLWYIMIHGQRNIKYCITEDYYFIKNVGF
jgi:hypothetical protein